MARSLGSGSHKWGDPTALFESIDLRIIDTGAEDGNGNSILIGDADGIFVGRLPCLRINHAFDHKVGTNTLGFGKTASGNTMYSGHVGVSFSAMDSLTATTLARAANIVTTVGVGNDDGNGNTVAIGNDNGLNVIFQGAGSPSSSGVTCPAARSDWGSLWQATGLPTATTFESIRVKLTGVGSNDGDNNTVSIGNQDGLFLGSGAGVPSGVALQGSVGNYDGDGNTVTIGSGNGVAIDARDGAIPVIGSGGSVTSSSQTVSASSLFGGSSKWFGLDMVSALESANPSVLNASSLSGYTSAFESVQIAVNNAGNHDGNNNTILVGNNDGITSTGAVGTLSSAPSTGTLSVGNDDGNDNVALVGNANGVNLYLTSAGGGTSVGTAGTGTPALTFESVQISISDSGNDDGNNNIVQIGSQNGISGGSLQALTSGLGASGGNTVIGSHDGNGNTIAIGNGNGVNLMVGGRSGLLFMQLSGAVSGYLLEDAAGDAWFGATPQEIMADVTANPLQLMLSSLPSLTFESVNITVANSGNNDGNNNFVGIGNGNGITLASTAKSFAGLSASGSLTVGSFDGNNNYVSIGESNGASVYV